MYRMAMENLIKWKANIDKKPLIIRGARQVGKTWLMKEFGKTYFDKTVYINFDSSDRMNELFSGDLDIARIVLGLELETGFKIDPKNTLPVLHFQ